MAAAVTLMFAGAVGCSGEVGGAPKAKPRPAPPASPGAVEPTCAKVDDAALAVFGEGCGVVVVATEDDPASWTLRELEEGAASPRAERVPVPPVCQRAPCRLGGGVAGETETWWVLAGVPSADSELIEDLWLVSAAGEAIDLWVEPPVSGDGTWLGPAHELWPHACEDGLALLPRARFDDGGQGTAAPETRAAARWLGDPARAASELPDAASCRPLALDPPA